MDLRLADKVVFVTGASGGIGRALAEAFLAEGSRLVLHAHSQLPGLQAWVDARPAGERQRVSVLGADVRDAEALSAALAAAVRRLGRVDVGIANAGAWPVPDVPLQRMDPERLRQTLEVNLVGAALTARAFLACLEQCGPRADGEGASLLFMGSTAGRFGERGHADYAAAKAGLVGLMESLKHEIVDLDPYGRVNLIQPGWTVTHRVRPVLEQPGHIRRVLATMPLRQLARAADIARTALWLASPALARHVSGQVITVAGGMEGRLRWAPEEIDEAAVRRRLVQD